MKEPKSGCAAAHPAHLLPPPLIYILMLLAKIKENKVHFGKLVTFLEVFTLTFGNSDAPLGKTSYNTGPAEAGVQGVQLHTHFMALCF